MVGSLSVCSHSSKNRLLLFAQTVILKVSLWFHLLGQIAILRFFFLFLPVSHLHLLRFIIFIAPWLSYGPLWRQRAHRVAIQHVFFMQLNKIKNNNNPSFYTPIVIWADGVTPPPPPPPPSPSKLLLASLRLTWPAPEKNLFVRKPRWSSHTELVITAWSYDLAYTKIGCNWYLPLRGNEIYTYMRTKKEWNFVFFL